MSFEEINKERIIGWYQKFRFDKDGNMHPEVNKFGDMGGRTTKKLQTFGALFPQDFTDKALLDLGCHLGYWCFEAAQRGASRCVGIDRGRKEENLLKLAEMNNRVAKEWDVYKNCEFYDTEIGRQWDTYGKFDVALCLSVYHHIYVQALDHDKIFKWFKDQLNDDGYLIYEGPINTKENTVPQNHIPKSHLSQFNESAIFGAARKYFNSIEYFGPSLHEKGRYIYKISNFK